MAFSFSGKKILVTGAGRGIGRLLTHDIVKAGGEVYALSRTKETLDSLAKESDHIHPIVADLTDWDDSREKLKALPPMDGVVNNAGKNPDTFYDITDIPKEVFENDLRLNLMGAINVTQVTAKKMIEAGKGGSIVNVSSLIAINPVKGCGHYNISKSALDTFTKQSAAELGQHQIRVNSVCPTLVLTESVQKESYFPTFEEKVKALMPLGRIVSEQEVVNSIMYLLSDYSSIVNGTQHVLDGGISSYTPF